MQASNVPGPTPISRLHDDILWSIFMFNSHMISYGFNDASILNVLKGPSGNKTPESALLTNRRTSQVFRRWWDVIIASPSIWANAIDLKYLTQRGDEWRNEVLKRTGDAPLSVIGLPHATVCKHPKYSAIMLPFLLKLLDVEWNRIRTLVIRSDKQAIDDQLRVLVLRPAPCLKNLHISLHKYGVGLKRLLFSNHAPCLQSLNAQGLSIDFSVSSWSSNLRYLNLGLHGLDIAIPDLLRSLDGMPFLENLRLWSKRSWDHPHLERNPSTLETPPFIFRNLQHITISDCQHAMPELISHIIVPPGCVLDITDSTFIEDIDTIRVPQDSAYWSCYTSYIQNNVVPITDLSFSIIYYPLFENSDGEFEDDDSEEGVGFSCFRVSLGGPHGQCFRFQCPSMGVSPIAFELARAISLCDLSKVTTLTLHLKSAKMTDIVEDDAFDNLVALISGFYSVKTLHTDDDTLKLFMDTENLVFDSRDEKYLFFDNVVTIFTDAWESGIVGFLRLGGVGEDLSVSRVIFDEDSVVPCGDPSVLMDAADMGITVGWKGAGTGRFKITFSDEGVLEFAPKY